MITNDHALVRSLTRPADELLGLQIDLARLESHPDVPQGRALMKHLIRATDNREYQPQLTVSRAKSFGHSYRTLWTQTGRIHHLLSNGEYLAFAASCVTQATNIREQFTFPREYTDAVGEALGFGRQKQNTKKLCFQRSSDLLITEQSGRYLAVEVKPASELDDDSVKRRLTIAHACWTLLGIEFRVWTESSCPWQVARNLDYLCVYQQNDSGAYADQASVEILEERLRQVLLKKQCPLHEGITTLAGADAKTREYLINLALRAIFKGTWKVDLSQPISPDHKVTFTN